MKRQLKKLNQINNYILYKDENLGCYILRKEDKEVSFLKEEYQNDSTLIETMNKYINGGKDKQFALLLKVLTN